MTRPSLTATIPTHAAEGSPSWNRADPRTRHMKRMRAHRASRRRTSIHPPGAPSNDIRLAAPISRDGLQHFAGISTVRYISCHGRVMIRPIVGKLPGRSREPAPWTGHDTGGHQKTSGTRVFLSPSGAWPTTSRPQPAGQAGDGRPSGTPRHRIHRCVEFPGDGSVVRPAGPATRPNGRHDPARGTWHCTNRCPLRRTRSADPRRRWVRGRYRRSR